jgi:hypothetical protein
MRNNLSDPLVMGALIQTSMLASWFGPKTPPGNGIRKTLDSGAIAKEPTLEIQENCFNAANPLESLYTCSLAVAGQDLSKATAAVCCRQAEPRTVHRQGKD